MPDFSVIIYIQHSRGIEKTLESLSNQNADIQVLLYDAADDIEAHGAITAWQGIENLVVEKAEGLSLSGAFNRGKNLADGKYICFINEDAVFSTGCFTAAKNGLEEDKGINALSLKPIYSSPQEGDVPYLISPKASGVYSVEESPEELQFNIKAFFFRTSEAKKIDFADGIGVECCNKFIIDYLLENCRYRFLAEKTVHYHTAMECDAGNFVDQLDKKWYFDNVEEFLLQYSKKSTELPERKRIWLQMAINYLLAVRFNNNFRGKNKGVLSSAESCRFFDLAGETLKYIDDDFIMMSRKYKPYEMDRLLRLFLIRLKFSALGLEYSIAEEEDYFYFDYGDGSFRKLIDAKNEKVKLYTMHYENNCLEVDFRTTADTIFGKENLSITVFYNGEPINVREIMDYPLIKCFGVTVMRRYGGHFSVPVQLDKPKNTIAFEFSWNGKRYPLIVKGSKQASKIGKSGSYWYMCKNRIVFAEKNCIIIKKASFSDWVKKEISFEKEYLKKNRNRRHRYSRIIQRWAMIIAQRTCRKRIWITFDKLYKAGDNGEYMYHYLHDNVKGIRAYYIISKGNADYERLKKENAKILIHNSWKCKLIAAKAEIVLATHPSIWEYCGFKKDEIDLFRDLFNAKLVCIQHGLTTMNNAQYQCRTYDDTSLYCCAAQCEAENIKRPIFGYDDSNIRMTGLARFDGLHDADKRQILIAPTWRRNIVNAGIAFNKKSYNDNFRNTEYFRVFNSLINDNRLIECAKRNNYRLIYMLHPAMSAQINDYDRNDYVEIIQATGDMNYERILTESSMMITDYSSIQFDFAYMRKPIIYYHPSSLPPQYDAGVFKYDTMGFGPIEYEHDGLIDAICSFMNDQCRNKEQYVKRADDFFMFHDFDNCRRIYEETNQWIKERNGR